MALDSYSAQEWKSVSAAAADSETRSGCFDCSICLDFAEDPVVTLCGHLYCWPCIYRWFKVQSASLASDESPQCPVCKAEISQSTVVPLYGRGQTSPKAEVEGKAAGLSVAVPPRPPACGTKLLATAPDHVRRLPYQNQHNWPHPYSRYEEDARQPMFDLNGSTAMGVFHPATGMFGEMVYARVFGNSESLYSYPNSYHFAGSSSPRMRRREMQAHESLSRISFFLFCCFLLCFLLF